MSRCRTGIWTQANITVQEKPQIIYRRVYKWPRLGDVPIWYFCDHARDVCTKCIYTDAKTRICLQCPYLDGRVHFHADFSRSTQPNAFIFGPLLGTSIAKIFEVTNSRLNSFFLRKNYHRGFR